jgi:hypothetical protein
VADDEDRGCINAAAPRGPREIHGREAKKAKKVPATKYGQYRNASPPSFPRFGGWHLFIQFPQIWWLAPFYPPAAHQLGNAGGSAIGRAIL